MGDKIHDFNGLVNRYALHPSQPGSGETLRVGQPNASGTRQVHTAERYKSRFLGNEAPPRSTAQLKEIANRIARHENVSDEERSDLDEAVAREKVKTLLHRELDGDSPLAQRVLQDYKNLYGHDLQTTSVSRADLYRLSVTADRVRQTVQEEREAMIVVNPRIEATKRAVRMITERFSAAKNKGPDHQQKLQELKNLQTGLDEIGPRANPDEVDAMAKKVIDEIGLHERYFGIGRIRYGVKANFRETLNLARAAVDRELKGQDKSPEQEQLRFAMNHIVTQLQDHRQQIEERIDNLSQAIERNSYKGAFGRGHPEYLEQTGRNPVDVKQLKRDLLQLKAAHLWITRALPSLSNMRSKLTHLSINPETDFAAAAAEVAGKLRSIDTSLNRHSDVLSKYGISHGVDLGPAADDVWEDEDSIDEEYGNDSAVGSGDEEFYYLGDANRGRRPSDVADVVAYADLFDGLKEDKAGVLASRMEAHESIAQRLADATKDRVWLWTPMAAIPDGSGLYRSAQRQTIAEQQHAHMSMDWAPGNDDAPEIRQEMQAFASKNDGADPFRRRILRVGREHRHELLRQFNAEAAAMDFGHDDSAYGAALVRFQLNNLASRLLGDVVSNRVDRMWAVEADNFMRENVWPEGILDRAPLQQSTFGNEDFQSAIGQLEAHARAAEAAANSGRRLQRRQLEAMKDVATTVRWFLENDWAFSSDESADVYFGQLDDIVRICDALTDRQSDNV